MAIKIGCSVMKQSVIPVTDVRFHNLRRRSQYTDFSLSSTNNHNRKRDLMRALAMDRNSSSSSGGGDAVPNSNYVVPLDSKSSSSCITRPLAEILRDLNKRIPDNIIIKADDDRNSSTPFIPWYHANRMLSFYAPGWCGEIRDVIFSDSGSVTVVYRVTVRGSDGEASVTRLGAPACLDPRTTLPCYPPGESAFTHAYPTGFTLPQAHQGSGSISQPAFPRRSNVIPAGTRLPEWNPSVFNIITQISWSP